MATYTVTILDETYRMRADFNEAASPIQFEDFDGSWYSEGKQVADFAHRPDSAMREFLLDCVADSGYADQIDEAVKAMVITD